MRENDVPASDPYFRCAERYTTKSVFGMPEVLCDSGTGISAQLFDGHVQLGFVAQHGFPLMSLSHLGVIFTLPLTRITFKWLLKILVAMGITSFVIFSIIALSALPKFCFARSLEST